MAELSDFKIRKLDGNATIRIVCTRELKIRFAIAVALFKVGCWVLGVGFAHEEPEEEKDIVKVASAVTDEVACLIPKFVGSCEKGQCTNCVDGVHCRDWATIHLALQKAHEQGLVSFTNVGG